MTAFTITHIAKPYPVFARKILFVLGAVAGGSVHVRLDDGDTFPIDSAMTARHYPIEGDYLIISDDGYAYLNPSEVFEKKYDRNTHKADAIFASARSPNATVYATESGTRFRPGDRVMFQPNLSKVSTPLEYDGAVHARVTHANILNDAPRYAIEVLDEPHGAWHLLETVHHLMLLPVNPDAMKRRPQPNMPTEAEKEASYVRMTALNDAIRLASATAASSFLDSTEILAMARKFEQFLKGDVLPLEAGPPPPIEIGQPLGASRLHELAPQDGPRVSSESVTDQIADGGEYYFTAREVVLALGQHDNPELGRMTFCILVLKSGFLVTGTSVCVSLENFDANTGRQWAYRNAVDRVADYMGFQLKQELQQPST